LETNFYNHDISICKEIDSIKDRLAKEHDVILIRIDCLESNKEYISNSILNSELSKIFDLSNIDWNYCAEKAMKNIEKEVCDFYNISDDKYPSYISQHFHIDRHTVVKYLKHGMELGWCNYDESEMRAHITKNTWKNKTKPLKVEIENDILVFRQIKDCCKYLSEKYTVHFDETSMRQCCRGERKTHRGLTFKYITHSEFNNIKSKFPDKAFGDFFDLSMDETNKENKD